MWPPTTRNSRKKDANKMTLPRLFDSIFINLCGVPKILYNYRSSKYFDDFIARPQIRLSPASSLNDPYEVPSYITGYVSDSAVDNLMKGSQHWDEYKNEYSAIYGSNGADELYKEFLMAKFLGYDDLKEYNREAGFCNSRDALQDIRENTCLFCLTPKLKNFLLWSHYAASHTGYAVGFDIERLCRHITGHHKLSIQFKPIYYTDTRPAYPLSKFHDDYIPMFTHKARCWEYEKEWRIIHIKPDEDAELKRNNYLIDVTPDCIKFIAFGLKNEHNTLDNRELIKKNLNLKDSQILRATLAPDKFEVIIIPSHNLSNDEKRLAKFSNPLGLF